MKGSSPVLAIVNFVLVLRQLVTVIVVGETSRVAGIGVEVAVGGPGVNVGDLVGDVVAPGEALVPPPVDEPVPPDTVGEPLEGLLLEELLLFADALLLEEAEVKMLN